MQFGISVTENLRSLNKMGMQIDCTSELLEGGERFIAGRVRQNIREGIDKFGSAFKPLSPATIKAKQRKHSRQPSKPLVDSGQLRDESISAKVIGTNEVKISVFNDDRREIALYHQKGMGVPKRAFFGVAPKDIARVYRQVKKLVIAKIMGLTRG